MKKIFIVLFSILATVGCMDKESFNVDNPIVGSSGTFVSPIEISFGDSKTKSFDEELNWIWEDTDKIYGYQVAGKKSVNTLTFVENNRFGTPEFAYGTNDPATFHFVYAGDASIDKTASGNRGIKHNGRQSGKWTPVLVGSALNKTFEEVMNDDAVIDMEHLSAALEVRLWREGVDKNNMTEADKKNIVYAELMSDTEYFLLDLVPTYNQDSLVSYAQRERGQDEEKGAYVRTEDVNGPVVVFNIAPHVEDYEAGALRLAIVDEGNNKYIINVPALNFIEGKRTILNVEWNDPSSANLPDGATFNTKVGTFLSANSDITKIQFIANSATVSDDVLVEGSVYLVKNGEILEIHTSADQFVANSNCKNMFIGYNSEDRDITPFREIVSVDFGDSFNTSQVVDMSSMFESCLNLASLDLSSFNTRNVVDIDSMFIGCSNLTSLDLSGFNTGNVVYMNSMFQSCKSLTSLDLSSFNTGNVVDMTSMFEFCSSLQELDVTSFNTEEVICMRDMFRNCSSLKSLDLSNFNTSNVKDMQWMFSDCSNLRELDVTSFNTEKLLSLKYMFKNCSNLELLDVSNFNTKNVQLMIGVFQGCSKLTSVDVSNFDTREVTWLTGLFQGCSDLTSIDISNFETEKLIECSNMFKGCSNLQEIDLSSFNTALATYMDGMFQDCVNLTSLDLTSFVFNENPSITNMFDNTGSDVFNSVVPIYVTTAAKEYIETEGDSNVAAPCVLVEDNTRGEDIYVAFENAVLTVSEKKVQVSIPVVMISEGDVTAEVSYVAVDGTARLGENYTLEDPDAKLIFTPESKLQYITINIIDNPGVITGNLMFNLELSSSDVPVGPDCHIVIKDEDSPVDFLIGKYTATGNDFTEGDSSWEMEFFKDDANDHMVWIMDINNQGSGWRGTDIMYYGIVSEDLKTITIPFGQESEYVYRNGNAVVLRGLSADAVGTTSGNCVATISTESDKVVIDFGNDWGFWTYILDAGTISAVYPGIKAVKQ